MDTRRPCYYANALLKIQKRGVDVMPSHLTASRRRAVLPGEENALSRRYLRVLERWIPVGLEYFAEWPKRSNCGHFFGGCHWYGLETITCCSVFAFAASSPEYDERVGQCSREELRNIALKGIRYLCFTHDTGPADCLRPEKGLGNPATFGTKWGERGRGFFPESQCGSTVAGMAIVALLLGDLVDDETWSMLVAIHEDYADRFGAMEPKSGVYVDTQMEENAWTSVGLASAALFLDRHGSARKWAQMAQRWMFSTVTTPQDAKNGAEFEGGATIARLTGKTFTALPDYMAENHGIVHPSYTASSVGFLGSLARLYGVFGAEIPKHAFFNRQKIYDQLKRITDSNGAMHPVQGMDWPYLPTDPGTDTHAAAALLLGDPDAAYFERRALEVLEARQRGNDGRMLDKEIAEKCHDIQDPVIMRELWIAGPAGTYLLHRLYGPGPEPTPEKEIIRKLAGVKTYPHSGFVFQKHAKGQTSFSWRNNVMALPLNKDGIYTVAPASNSLLGAVRVKDRPDSHDLISIRVDEQEEGFAAVLLMDRAQGTIRQEVLFAGLPNGTSLLWERFFAKNQITVERVDQGFLRIINENFRDLPGNCNGSRTFYTSDRSEVFHGYVSQNPGDDVIRTYEHPRWVNVDDRLGIVYRGSGKTVYHNRHYFRPWWAVADDLTLSRLEEPFKVNSGDLVSELVALVAPDQPHTETKTQRLIILSAPNHAAGLIGDGYLAAANFGEQPEVVRYVAGCDDLDEVPIFEGDAEVWADSVAYLLPLEAGAVTLRKALLRLSTSGHLKVMASVAGGVLAQNVQDKEVMVKTDRSEGVLSIRPGEIIRLL